MSKIKVLISGCGGRLGSAIVRLAQDAADIEIMAGVDPLKGGSGSFPVYESIADFTGSVDVIIDSSHHSAATALCEYAAAKKIPLLIATTGHTDDELALIRETAKSVPVFKSGNMSLGINLLASLVKKAAAILGDSYNIEIVEKHHAKKLDAPSGTALMLADAASSAVDYDAEYTYDRHAVRRERPKNEIGIHSVRGGTIVGEHEVIFAGPDEVITLSHSAASRDVFASGAIAAARFLCGKAPGYYTMDDLV